MVSLGIIADSMDLRDLETRWYVLEGLKIENQKNDFLNELECVFLVFHITAGHMVCFQRPYDGLDPYVHYLLYVCVHKIISLEEV